MVLTALRNHRQWVVLIVLAAVVLAVAAVISLRLVEKVSKGPAFQASATFLRANPIARQQLGVVSGFGVGVAGDVTEEGAGGSAEVLLLEPAGDGRWQALVRPYRRLRDGERLSAGALEIEIVEHLGEGRARR